MDKGQSASAQPGISARQWLTAAAVVVGGTMSSIDTFILYVATPNLRGVFSATVAEISAVSTSYAIAAMLLMLLSAWLVQRFGSKRVYQGGLACFVLGSALCALAPDLHSLIWARVVQGIGAGTVLPVEGAILRRTFPPERHALVLGLYGTSIMCGPAFGPMLGGLILDNFGWPLLFLVNIPFGLIGLIMVQHFVEDQRDGSEHHRMALDIPGLALLAVAIVSLIWLLERGNRTVWFEEPFNVLLLLAALAAWALFFAHERMVARPLLDMSALANRAFNAANGVNFMASFIISGTLFVLPIFMQESLHFSPTDAGRAMAPRAFAMMLAFPLAGWLFVRVPTRLLITAGLLMGMASGVMMSRFTVDTGWDDMLLPQIVQGLGAAFVLGPVTTSALMSIARERMAAGAAIESTTRLLGSTTGIAVFASLLTHFETRLWEIVRHDVTLGSPVFFKHFNGLLYWFRTDSAPKALEKGYRMLEARVLQQVLSLSYMYLFQLVVAGFTAMLIISLFISMPRKMPAPS